MDAAEWLRSARYAVVALRAEYEAEGRGAEFDRQVDRLRADGRWPFED
jgi:hypothetical protein